MSQRDGHLNSLCRKFVERLYENFLNRDIYALEELYTHDWPTITETFFKTTPWPTSESIESFVDSDANFILFYRELYFRHLFERCQPTVENMFDAFGNYLHLFNFVLSLDVYAPEVELPAVWLWDILDSFVLQFNRFHTYRHALPKDVPKQSMTLLRDHEHVWSAQTVTRYLQVLIRKSEIDLSLTHEQVAAQQAEKRQQFILELQQERPDIVDDEDIVVPQASPFFLHLGPFSAVALLSCYTILGDHFSALETLKPFDLNSKHNPWLDVVDVYATLTYYSAWSNLLLRRYTDAVRSVTSFLNYVADGAHFNPNAARLHHNVHGLLRLASAVVSQKFEDSIEARVQEVVTGMEELVSEKFKRPNSHKKVKLTEQETLTLVFVLLGPAFIDTNTPRILSGDADADSEETSSSGDSFDLLSMAGISESSTQKLQRQVFFQEMQDRQQLESIESYLRLCTTVPTTKLASFLQTSEDEVNQLLLSLKHKRVEKIRGQWMERASLVRFHVDNDMVCVSEQAGGRRHDPKTHLIRTVMSLENLVERIQKIGSSNLA